MGLSAPAFPAYDVAVANLSEAEVQHLSGSFRSLSRGRDIVTLQGFVEVRP